MMTGETLTPRATPLYMKPCVHFFIETLSLETKARGINAPRYLMQCLTIVCNFLSRLTDYVHANSAQQQNSGRHYIESSSFIPLTSLCTIVTQSSDLQPQQLNYPLSIGWLSYNNRHSLQFQYRGVPGKCLWALYYNSYTSAYYKTSC